MLNVTLTAHIDNNAPDLYEMVNMQEAGFKPAYPNTWASVPLSTSNVSQSSGVTEWVDIGLINSAAVQWIQSLTGMIAGIPVDNPSLWSGAYHQDNVTGTVIYNGIQKPDGWHIHWPICMMASPDGDNPPKYPPQRIAVVPGSGYNGFMEVAGIPFGKTPSVDFMYNNGYGGAAYSYGGTYYLTANGKLFFVPYLIGGFGGSAGFSGKLYIRTKYLRQYLGKAQTL